MKRVAVLGAGIMGSATALFLARRHVRVSLFDAADQPFAAASRWNEGKIHLGYLYAAGPSLETAMRLLPGALAFKPLSQELIGCRIDEAVAQSDDIYLVHRDSVTNVEAAARYFEAVCDLVASHPEACNYLVPVRNDRPYRLSRAEIEADFDAGQICGGFRVPERSISTRWVADRFVAALGAEPAIEQRLRCRVFRVRLTNGSMTAPLYLETSDGLEGPFDYIVNALWEGRLAIDDTLNLQMPPTWSHRFRLSAFVRASRALTVPCAVIGTGPFGDVKNYNGRDFYLSWYLTGLIAEGSCVAPPSLPTLDCDDRKRMVGEILERLGNVILTVPELASCGEDVRLEGGWVYAVGNGSLADPRSTLHQRHRVGITRAGSYISVDTGKYSIAPFLAREVAEAIQPG